MCAGGSGFPHCTYFGLVQETDEDAEGLQVCVVALLDVSI